MRLIVVGNGFDLHHKLKTSYKDYHEFLKQNVPDLLLDLENLKKEWYFTGNFDELWRDVEANLKFGYEDMLKDCIYDY